MILLNSRLAWMVSTCRRGMRLTRGGAASHLRAVNDLAKRYGYFLDFVSRSRRLEPEAKAGAHVTLENVEQYAEELKGRVSSVTVYGSIQKLRRITQLIAPEQEVAWLMEIERELFSQMRPRSKWDRVVLTEVIVEAGLTLIAEAEMAAKLRKLTRARMVRNGLMLTLLAHSPIRLKELRRAGVWPQHRQSRRYVVDLAHGHRDQGKASRRAAHRGRHWRSHRQVHGSLSADTHPWCRQHQSALDWDQWTGDGPVLRRRSNYRNDALNAWRCDQPAFVPYGGGNHDGSTCRRQTASWKCTPAPPAPHSDPGKLQSGKQHQRRTGLSRNHSAVSTQRFKPIAFMSSGTLPTRSHVAILLHLLVAARDLGHGSAEASHSCSSTTLIPRLMSAQPLAPMRPSSDSSVGQG